MHYLEVTEIDKPYPDALEDFLAKNSIIHQNRFGKLKYFDGEKDFAHFIKTGIDMSELASEVTRFRGMSDGSFEKDTGGGWAFTIWEGDQIVYYAYGSCDVATSQQAEIVGYAKLIDYLVVQEINCPAITDYQPMVTSLEDISLAPNEIRDAICFIKGQLKYQTIQPCWTPREYNHPTDLLAGMGRSMSEYDYDVLGYDVTWSVELLQRIATFVKFDLTYEHMDFNPAILKTMRILRLKRDVEQIKMDHFFCLSVDNDSKHKTLLKILNCQGARKVVVYVKNLNKIKMIIHELGKGKILAKAIHNDVLINKEKRSSITSEFSKGECGVLISCVMPYDDLFKVPEYDTFIYFDRPGNEDVYIESLKTFGTHIKVVSIVAPYESKKWTDTMEEHGMRVIKCDV